ncbi:uncharacterized protein LOC128744305 [Sabethes cyaneus]|uniref:uncharacterized protein LOC128744305 n=1 Tax=Sabethes cyaneus TaxID=53552 RepID=UPI00237D64E6|nr:uncharacterized protein LOC128744305 [Sabethes cyaneus]
MVRVTAYVHTPVYNYSHKYRNLDKISNDVKKFLEEYDQIILHKDIYRGVFHSYLRDIRAQIKQLLLKFDALPYDDERAKTDKELFCCGLQFHEASDLRMHYKAAHNGRFERYTNILELKAALGKLDHMRHRLKEYITFGQEYTLSLIINLKRVLKKISNSLKF